MLIVSKFHDYYDTAIGVAGVDKSVVYNRQTKQISKGRGNGDANTTDNRYSSIKINGIEYNYRLRCIGFCGGFYPLVEVEEIWTNNHGIRECKAYIFYDKNNLLNYVKQNKILKKKIWNFAFGYRGGNLPLSADIRSEREIESFYDLNNWGSLKSIFRKHNTPVFIVGYYIGININPELKKWKFAKIKDPFTAFQDIYMYISGVLGVDNKPMVQISDKDMAHKKGHGGKYSFKKPPGSKKRGKK